MRSIALGFAIICFLLGATCRQRQEGSEERRFEIRGTVVSVDKARRQATIAHEEILGLMGAMTMPFRVKEDWALQVLAPGQRVQATLVISSGLSWIENIVITQPPDGSAAAAAAGEAVDPKPGAEVPDMMMTDQDGNQFRLREYRGRALLITFIYTRCPLPDYCVKMSSNFATIVAALRKDRFLGEKVRLLSISFDPEFDKPEVLREYARAYLEGQWPDALRLWRFASGTADQVQAVTRFFGLQYWNGSGQIVHSLRTVLIGADGKVVRLYTGNEWTPEQVLADLKSLYLP